MFCPKCGTQNEDASKFCFSCGEMLEAADPVEAQPPVEPQVEIGKKAIRSIKTEKTDLTAVFQKLDPKLLKGIGAAVAAVLVLVLVVSLLSSLGGGKEAYVYVSDGEYMLLKDLGQEEAIEIADVDSHDLSGGLGRFSPDGKYFYFFVDIQEGNGTYYGDLYRAEFAKLKEDSGKNSQYIERIAKDVNYFSLTILENGDLLYAKYDYDAIREQHGDLYLYNGKEATRVAKEVYCGYGSTWSYDVDDSGRMVYVNQDDDERNLYWVKLKDPDSKTKLASDIATYYCAEGDLKNILVTKRDADEELTLYLAGIGRETEKLAEKVTFLNRTGDTLYLTAPNGAELNLLDYVDQEDADEYLLEDLDDPDNALQLQTLYRITLQKGKLEVICESVLEASCTGNGIVYLPADTQVDKLDIADLYSVYEVENALEEEFAYNIHILLISTGKTCKLSSAAFEELVENEDADEVYFGENKVYLVEYDGDLLVAQIKKGEVGKFTFVDDDVYIVSNGSGDVCIEGDTLYYLKDADTSDYYAHGDLYVYNGEKTCLAKDISTRSIYLYEDGTVFAYMNYDSGSGTLVSISKKGQVEKVDKRVNRFVRVDKSTVLYIRNGDLYVYDGKDSQKLGSDVLNFFCLEVMDFQYLN